MNQTASIIICAELAVRYSRAQPPKSAYGRPPRIDRPVVGCRGLVIGAQELNHQQNTRESGYKGKRCQHLSALRRKKRLRAAKLLEERIVGLADDRASLD